MKKSTKVYNRELVNVKSINEVMQNAYRIAESSGFYTPIYKEDWVDK